MQKEKIRNIFVKVGLIILLVIYIVSICPIEIQSDTLFDIKCGELFVNEGVTEYDTLSIHENLKYVSHHFVPTILLYYIYKLFGFVGIHILEVILTLIIALLFYRLNNIITKNKLYSYLSVYVEMFMLKEFISVRAQMFSCILFLLQLILVNILKNENITKKQRIFIYISLIMLPMIIVNVHAGVWPFYYIIMGVYFIAALINKKEKLAPEIIAISAIAMPFMLLNVYKMDGITYVFKTLGNSFISNNVIEFRALSINSNIIIFVSVIVIVVTTLCIKKKKTIEEILFLIGTIFMTFYSIRHFIFVVICFPILLNIYINIFQKIVNEIKKMDKMYKIMFIVVISVFYTELVISICCTKSYKFLGNEKIYPKNAVRYIKENIGTNKRILNSYNYGSYMLFEDIKVFLDNRADLYTEEYNSVTIAQDATDLYNCNVYYMDIIEKYNVEYVFVEKDRPIVKFLKKDNRFEVVYEDEYSSIIKYNK